MARYKVGMRKKINVGRVVGKIATVVIVLWVGGTILTEIGDVMNGTSSPFYSGLSLIGWTVDATNTITSTSGSGILAVVGIIAVASIVLEFVEFKLK